MNAPFSDELKKMARYRNRLVHLYWQIDAKELWSILTTRLDDLNQFVEAILSRLDDL